MPPDLRQRAKVMALQVCAKGRFYIFKLCRGLRKTVLGLYFYNQMTAFLSSISKLQTHKMRIDAICKRCIIPKPQRSICELTNFWLCVIIAITNRERQQYKIQRIIYPSVSEEFDKMNLPHINMISQTCTEISTIRNSQSTSEASIRKTALKCLRDFIRILTKLSEMQRDCFRTIRMDLHRLYVLPEPVFMRYLRSWRTIFNLLSAV